MPREPLLTLRLERATALRRLNRFVVEAEKDGQRIRLHTRNTGRLLDLLHPGAQLLYEHRPRGKTRGVIIGVEIAAEAAAVIDPRTQAAAFEEAWRRGLLGWLNGWRMVDREAWFRGSRIDYMVEGPGDSKGLLELKSAVYLSEHDRACMYPDTVSERGRRHVDALVEARRSGLRAIIAFISAHPLCRGFRPCCEVDPILCEKLRTAKNSGVEVHAVKMHLEGGEIFLDSDNIAISLK